MRCLHSHQGAVFNVLESFLKQKKGSAFKKTFNDPLYSKNWLGLLYQKDQKANPVSIPRWAVQAHFPSVSITVKSDNNFLLVGFLWMLNEVLDRKASLTQWLTETIRHYLWPAFFLVFPDSFLWKQWLQHSDRCPDLSITLLLFVTWFTSHFGTWCSFKSKILCVLETQLKSFNQRKVMLTYKYWKEW